MSWTTEVLGYGTKFEVLISSTYTAVFQEPIDIEPPADKWGKIDTFNFSSASMMKTFILGVGTPGECKVKAHYNAAEFDALVGYGQTLQAWRIVYNDLTSSDYSGLTFSGYLTEKPQKVNLEGLVTTEITIAVSGPTTWIGTITTP